MIKRAPFEVSPARDSKGLCLPTDTIGGSSTDLDLNLIVVVGQAVVAVVVGYLSKIRIGLRVE